MPETAYAPDPRRTPLQFPASRGYGDIRERVTTARTYYVKGAGGSDTFDGLSPGAGFATLSKAIDVVHGLDIAADVNVTIQLMDGTHTISSQLTIRNFSGIGQVIIQGNLNDTSAVTVVAGAASIIMLNFIGAGGSRWFMRAFTMQGNSSNTGINLSSWARVTIGSMRWTSGFSTAISIASNSFFQFNGSAYEVTASMGTFLLAQRLSVVVNTTTCTFTISNTPAWSSAFVVATMGSVLQWQASTCTFSGSATGVRYATTTNGLINTSGGASTYFPGDSAGTTATQGQYV